MAQMLPEQRDASGEASRAGTPQHQLQGTRGPVAFEVWQFRMYHRSHIITSIFFVAIGLLQALTTQQLQASLASTMIFSAIFAPLRHAAHHAKDQELAHLIMEYVAFAVPTFRLIVVNFAVPENSVEPLEICLQAYGWDILRPVAMSIVLSTIPMRRSFVVIVNVLYAVRLAITITTLMSANNLGTVEDSMSLDWDLRVSSMLPVYVFAVSLFANMMSMRHGQSAYEHMVQLQRAHRQEVLAKEHAIRCEHRAHEAERQTAEERLQQRNKYLGAMCHDFGTPVSVLQMLLLMMRKHVMRDLQRQRKDAATSSSGMPNPPVSQQGGAATGDGVAEQASRADSSASANEAARPLECFEDSARMLDLVRRASAGLELLELTRQKAIAFSKLQAGGTLVPDRKPFEMAELMRKSASIARDTGKSDRVTVQTHTDADVPFVVETDANWLFMILVNFASNSMKHTRQGSVTISAMRVGKSRLRFEVSDTGSGVPAEFVPSLFQPFSSASTTATSVESTGLGLYHSKQLAEILGGSVGFRPNAGCGATFYVEVPIKLITAARAKRVLAKNRLELAEFEDVAAALEQDRGGGVHQMHVPGASRGSMATDAPVLVAAAATAAATATATATATEAASLHDGAVAAGGLNGEEGAGSAVELPSDAARHFGSDAHAGSRKMPASISALDKAAASSEAHSLTSSSSFSLPSQSLPPSHAHPLPPPSSASPSSPVLPLQTASSSRPSSQPQPATQTRALTAVTASHHWAPSAPLTSLLSRLPPPLIVDDSELSRNVMREQLNSWAGVMPMEAESGEEALLMLTAEPQPMRVSSVLLAVHMFGLDGRETCRAIRKWEQSRGVAQNERLRIVGLLTVTNDEAGRAACLDAGMDDAIVKPFDAATLHSTLHKFLL